MSEKATKAKAEYRAGSRNRRCGLCTMFRPPHGCTAVAGQVSADGVCDYFKRAGEGRARNWYGKKD